MKYCNQCGTPLDDDARFCAECGKAIEVEQNVTSPNTSSQQTTYNPNQQTEAYESQYQQSQPAMQSIPPSAPIYTPPYNAPAGNMQSMSQTAHIPPQMTQSTTISSKCRTLGIVGFILGMISLVFSWLGIVSPIFGIFIIPCAIVGLVLTNKSKNFGNFGLTKAGKIISIIGLVLSVLFFIIGLIILIAALTAINRSDGLVHGSLGTDFGIWFLVCDVVSKHPYLYQLFSSSC